MSSAIASVAALLLSVAILLAGNGLLGTLLPVRAQLEGFSTVAIGALGSGYFLGFAVGCVYGPRLVRRVGHIRTFTAMTAVAAAIALAHVLLIGSAPWWLMRVATGFCFAALFVVIESWLNERSTNETRGTVLGIYLIISLTVVTLGQLMLTLASPTAFTLFAAASMLVSLAAVPVALSGAPSPGPVQTPRIRVLHIARISPVGFAACLAVGLANGAFWSLGPLFAQLRGMDATGVAVFMSACVIGGAAGQWPFGRLSDRMDRRQVMLVACAGALLTALAIIAVKDGPTPSVFLLGALWGACTMPIYSLAVAHTNDFAAPEEMVEVSSSVLLLYGAGAVVGPIVTSAVIDHVGARGLFACTSAVHLVLMGFVAWRMTRREPPPASEQVPFIDALSAAQTISVSFEVPAEPAEPSSETEAEHPELAHPRGGEIPSGGDEPKRAPRRED